MITRSTIICVVALAGMVAWPPAGVPAAQDNEKAVEKAAEEAVEKAVEKLLKKLRRARLARNVDRLARLVFPGFFLIVLGWFLLGS